MLAEAKIIIWSRTLAATAVDRLSSGCLQLSRSQTGIFIGKVQSVFGILIESWRRSWRTSFCADLGVSFRDSCLDWEPLKPFGATRLIWLRLVEGLFLLLLALMPLVKSWTLLLPLLLLLWVLKEPKNMYPQSGLLLFSVVLLSSAIIGGYLRSASTGLVRIGAWLLIAWLVGQVGDRQLVRKVINLLLFASLFWMTLGFWQQWSGTPTPPGWLESGERLDITVRSYSIFGNPNVYALYLLTVLIFGVTALSHAGNIWARLGYLLVTGLSLISLYFTYSRTAWLLGIVFLVATIIKQSIKDRWRLLAGGVLLLLCLNNFWIRLIGLFSGSSWWYRVKIWTGVGRMLRDYWLWGAGSGSFGWLYPWYQVAGVTSQHAHQFYLQFWLENGLISLFFFAWLVGKNLRQAGSWDGNNGLALVLTAFLIFGLAETWSASIFLGGYFWFLFGLLLADRERTESS